MKQIIFTLLLFVCSMNVFSQNTNCKKVFKNGSPLAYIVYNDTDTIEIYKQRGNSPLATITVIEYKNKIIDNELKINNKFIVDELNYIIYILENYTRGIYANNYGTRKLADERFNNILNVIK